METFVKYVFVFQICVAPLGFLAAIFYVKAARKAHEESKHNYYRALALSRFVGAFLDASFGSLGYYLVTRRVFPWLESSWLLLLVGLSGLVGILLTNRAANIRIRAQQMNDRASFTS